MSFQSFIEKNYIISFPHSYNEINQFGGQPTMNRNISNDIYEHNTMTLTGEGQVSATPDIAIIRLGVETTGQNLVDAQSENARISNKVFDSLTDMGVSEIKTFQYTIDKNITYENGTRVDHGFVVRNIFEIKTNELDQTGEIIDTAVSNGANIVEFITFQVSNPDFYYKQALNMAVGNALSKSKSIAMYLGLPSNPVPFKIVENNMTIPTPLSTFRERAATPIVAGSYQISASVTVAFYY